MSQRLSFEHEMLVANAGSGKTHTLTTRIICLLLAGVSVDRIAALTFTRKSAGEFLDKLLLRLADAATDPKELASLAKSTRQARLSEEDCCRLLEHIVEHFGRLGLSTIDSFFARIARQFPLESGLPEEFSIADTASLSNARERALAACFTEGTEGDEALQSMIEQCRQISRKRGERNVFGMLLDQIGSLHQKLFETPASCLWGDANRIWKGQLPFASAPTREDAIEHFERTIGAVNPDLSGEALEYLDTHLNLLRALEPGQAWSKAVKNFVKQKLTSAPRSGKLQLTRKKTGYVELTPELERARQQLADSLFADILHQTIERSQGLHAFVSRYEAVYSELVRKAGLISFGDITCLLAERAGDSDTADGLDWHTQVAYRIDQHFDHWLIDEFQDTSRTQWTILSAFIEEVVMDESKQRSFFYVGDTKQAIYGWRGGDATLFNEIYEHYRPAIQPAIPLSQSWRSTEPIIKMVNCLFGQIDVIGEELGIPEETQTRWRQSWNSHEVAESKQGKTGYAAWLPVEKNETGELSAQYEAIGKIIQNVDPLAKGIECAVLLRQNKDVAELAAYLQSEGIAVAVEGKSNPCTDNLLGSAALAALRAAAHPGDSLSAGIARGLPCAKAWGLHDMDAFRTATLQSIAEQGYAKTLQRWFELALPRTGTSEAFLTDRANTLLTAAEDFDTRSHGEGIDAFIAYIESLELQEAEASEAIRIMTVHQAKGLGFEMVIVAGLDKSVSARTTDELVLGPDKKDPQWGLLMPPQNITERDPILREQSERFAAEAHTNELCSAYVALTRAKQALYVISDELTARSSAKHFGRHLQLALGEAWEAGNPEWGRD